MYLLTFSNASRHGRRSGASGFTIIEMTVAMGVGLLILGAAFTLLNQLIKMSETVVKIAEMNQNLRAGTDLIIRDLTNSAGGIPIGGVSLPGGAGCAVAKRPGPGLAAPPAPLGPQTFSNCAAGSMGALPAVSPGQQLGPTINTKTSDEITMISVDQSFAVANVPTALVPTTIAAHPAACTIATCTGWTLTVPAAPSIAAGSTTAVNVGDIYMFINTNGAALGYVTAVNSGANTITFDMGDPPALNQPRAAAGTLSSLGPGGVYPATKVYKILMVSYFLDNTQAGNPRLMRQLGDNAALAPALAVADGINFLEISYDLSDGATTDVRDVLSLAPHTPNEVRKVNLSIAANTQPLSSGPRKIFVNDINTAVTVRDLAYRNAY
jgi:Tfp pilus assembly protein PilW